MAPQAAGVGVGGTGFLIVVLLIVMVIAICLALVGSLHRLRKSVEAGTFGQPGQSADRDTTTRDPAAPGGEGV